MQTDPISDLLTQVRNATRARHPKVDMPSSQMKLSIVEILKKEGYVRNYKLFQHESKPVLRIYLKYGAKGNSIIRGISRISRPSRRIYRRHTEIPKILGGLGIAVISTSSGIVADSVARENRLGGEVLCSVW